MPHRDEEGNRLVERIGGLLPAEHIHVPVGKRDFAMIERAGFISQAEVVFVHRHRVPDAEFGAIECRRMILALLREDLAALVKEGETKRRFLDRDRK
jgi:hypothetical protein